MPDRKIDRRTVLLAAGVGIGGLAGCNSETLGGENSDDEDETDAPPSTSSAATATTAADDGGLLPEEETTAARTTEESTPRVTRRLDVVSAAGFVTDDDRIGRVELVVRQAPGSGDIDLSTATLSWIDSGGTYMLTSAAGDGGGGDAEFGLLAVKDPTDSFPTIDAPEDRFLLVCDLGAPTDEYEGPAPPTAFGEPLGEGSSATLKLTLSSGAETVVRLAVPETLAGSEVVEL